MNTAAPARAGRGLDALILIAALLAIGIGVAWFMGRQNGPAPVTAPVEALNGLALDAQRAAAGEERAFSSLEISLKELKAAAAASPDAPFAKDERYNRIVLSTKERFGGSVGNYRRFFAACKAGDSTAAERVIHESMRWAVDLILDELPSEQG